jgi:hypothetical protein
MDLYYSLEANGKQIWCAVQVMDQRKKYKMDDGFLLYKLASSRICDFL